MAGRRLSAAEVPTPGPWLVRGEPGPDSPAAAIMLGVEMATDERPGGWPYFLPRDWPIEPGGSSLHIAVGIQRLADAKLLAAAPDLAALLLELLTAPALMAAGLDDRTRNAITRGWDLLVRVAPQLEVGR
ncbi:hypothetical protein [Methylobacterium brachythecii]|uniref:Uncharacterized protein n=1 Tax=Methylobacterium brachythecii TaxID=1176177 RepID=A0A7W6F7N1_9HYPH|nr:hypothetical protein [Methylobacterium brachythecii]MBB3903637.1 hypothetical protein [Methylobacterium brachythecii]GLS44206.1 hypothetical protein GCM10007884_21940 [Methylobacterium brachythecii]